MRPHWTKAANIIAAWRFKTGARAERLVVLGAAWEKEFGHMGQHWKLQGIQRGNVYISPKSPAAALELRMQASTILRSLNKYFKSPWIKGIRTTPNARTQQIQAGGRKPEEGSF